VHCPTNKKIYVVWNSTAGDVTFKTVAGTGIPVNAGSVLILYCDGTNVIQLAGLVATIDDIGDVVITAAASGQMLRFNGSSWVNEDSPYDVGMFIPGTHGNGALMAQVVLSRAVSFADDFAGARAYAGVSATRPCSTSTGTAPPSARSPSGSARPRAPLPQPAAAPRRSRRVIASRSSTRTRPMPRSPISRLTCVDSWAGASSARSPRPFETQLLLILDVSLGQLPAASSAARPPALGCTHLGR
jgi:hypothetical protein